VTFLPLPVAASESAAGEPSVVNRVEVVPLPVVVPVQPSVVVAKSQV